MFTKTLVCQLFQNLRYLSWIHSIHFNGIFYIPCDCVIHVEKCLFVVEQHVGTEVVHNF
jgi:hypothetical protein